MFNMPEPDCSKCARYHQNVITGRSTIKESCTKRWSENCPDYLELEESQPASHILDEKICKLLINIQAFYNASRQVGHTETLKRGFLSRPDALVLIAHGNHQPMMQHRNCITLHQMAVRPVVDYARPLVIDNTAMREICKDAFNLINKLAAENSMIKAELFMLRQMKNKEPG